jgi:hypothetical protein
MALRWMLRNAPTQASPPVQEFYSRFASILLPIEAVRWIVGALFVDLPFPQMDQVTVCLRDVAMSYCLCLIMCSLYTLVVNFIPCMSGLLVAMGNLVRMLARQVSSIRRCLQWAPFAAMWCFTLVLQETLGMNALLSDCFGYDLSLLRWVLPYLLSVPIRIMVDERVKRLPVTMRVDWVIFCEFYWIDVHPYRTVLRNVFTVLAAYLAVAFIPLRYGHYLCPLASTAVRTVLRADGSSVLVTVPQIQTLLVVAFGPMAVIHELMPLLPQLVQNFKLDAPGYAAGTPEVPRGEAGRAAAEVCICWLLLTVCTSWAIHASVWLGESFMDALASSKAPREWTEEELLKREQVKYLFCGMTGLAIYHKVVLKLLHIALVSLLRQGGALGWMWKWVEIVVVLCTAAAPPVLLSGAVMTLITSDKEGVTSVYPRPVLPLLLYGISGLNICYGAMRL